MLLVYKRESRASNKQNAAKFQIGIFNKFHISRLLLEIYTSGESKRVFLISFESGMLLTSCKSLQLITCFSYLLPGVHVEQLDKDRLYKSKTTELKINLEVT